MSISEQLFGKGKSQDKDSLFSENNPFRKPENSQNKTKKKRKKDSQNTNTQNIQENKEQEITQAKKKIKSHQLQELIDSSIENAAAIENIDIEEQPKKKAKTHNIESTIYVGNLPIDLKKKDITNLFRKYGPIASIRERSVPIELEGKQPRRAKIIKGKFNESRSSKSAYVVFADRSAAEAALAANMTIVGSKHVRVDLAASPSDRAKSTPATVQYDLKRSVFIGNLAFDIEDEDVITLFNSGHTYVELQDSVDAVRVVRDATSLMSKGVGFVQFKTQEAARVALNLDGTEVQGRPIRVRKAKTVPGPKPPIRSASRAGGHPRAADEGRQRRARGRGFGGDRGDGDSDEDEASWRGARTKGRGKLSFGGAAGGGVSKHHGMAAAGGKAQLRKISKATGKRPAVAARKASYKQSKVQKATGVMTVIKKQSLSKLKKGGKKSKKR